MPFEDHWTPKRYDYDRATSGLAEKLQAYMDRPMRRRMNQSLPASEEQRGKSMIDGTTSQPRREC